MTTRLLIAYSVVALIMVALAVAAARASARRRRRRPSRDHLRVDLFAGDGTRSKAGDTDDSPAEPTAAS
jgi:hypothetical protein